MSAPTYQEDTIDNSIDESMIDLNLCKDICLDLLQKIIKLNIEELKDTFPTDIDVNGNIATIHSLAHKYNASNEQAISIDNGLIKGCKDILESNYVIQEQDKYNIAKGIMYLLEAALTGIAAYYLHTYRRDPSMTCSPSELLGAIQNACKELDSVRWNDMIHQGLNLLNKRNKLFILNQENKNSIANLVASAKVSLVDNLVAYDDDGRAIDTKALVAIGNRAKRYQNFKSFVAGNNQFQIPIRPIQNTILYSPIGHAYNKQIMLLVS